MKSTKLFFVGIFISTLTLTSCYEEKVYESPTQLISVEFAKELHVNYNSLAEKKADTLKQDANAIWYSVEELERYLHYVKTEGKNKGYDVEGVHLYFGRYPNDPKYNEKAGMATIFISPTGEKTETQKASLLNISTTQAKGHSDITDLSPLNYGSMGNPPKLTYPN